MRPQRVRIIGSSSGCVTLKKPLSETSITLVPLLGAHAGKHRVVVHAGVVDDDLHRPAGEQALAGRCARRRRCTGRRRSHSALPPAATMRAASACAGLGPRVGMQHHVGAVARQALGDRLAERAAGAGDEGALSGRGSWRWLPCGKRRVRGRPRRGPRPAARPRASAREIRRGSGARRPTGAAAMHLQRAARQSSSAPAGEAHVARARQEAGRRRARPPARSAPPCRAIACAAYSIALGASRPLRGAQRVVARRGGRRRCSGSRSRPRRPGARAGTCVPRCGMRASMPAWSSVWARLMRALRRGRPTSSTLANGVPCAHRHARAPRSRGAASSAIQSRERPAPGAARRGGRARASRCGRPTG